MDGLEHKSSHLNKMSQYIVQFLGPEPNLQSGNQWPKEKPGPEEDGPCNPTASVCVITSPDFPKNDLQTGQASGAVIFLFAQKGLVPGSML